MLLLADVIGHRRQGGGPGRAGAVRSQRAERSGLGDSAVAQLDYLARINPLYQRLFSGFDERIGCPVLANTSFNLHGKPIVCTPEDAFRSAEIKLLVGGNGILDKTRQNLP